MNAYLEGDYGIFAVGAGKLKHVPVDFMAIDRFHGSKRAVEERYIIRTGEERDGFIMVKHVMTIRGNPNGKVTRYVGSCAPIWINDSTKVFGIYNAVHKIDDRRWTMLSETTYVSDHP